MNDTIRKIAIDIETIENEKMIPFLPDPEIALGNTKDPEKIKAKKSEARKKQIEKMALDPTTGRICAVGICGNFGQESCFHVIDEISDSAEISLINVIFGYLKIGTLTPKLIITCNGTDFDLPYIYKRAMILKIDIGSPISSDVEMSGFIPKLSYWTNKSSTSVHFDIQRVWKGFKSNFQFKSNLDYLSRMILEVGKTDRDYSTYSKLIREGKSDKIGIDALSDSELTYELYNRMQTYLCD